MAITFGDDNTATVTSGDITLTKPTGVVNDDYLVTFIGRDDDVEAPGLPDGWTLFAELLEGASGDDRYIGCYHKKITNSGGEPADYTWTWVTDTNEACCGMIQRVVGANLTTFEDVTYVQGTHLLSQTNLTNPNPVTITTNTDNAFVIIFSLGINNTDSVPVTPSGMSNPAGYTALGAGYVEMTGVRHPNIIMAHKDVTTAAAEDPAAFTGAANANDFTTITFAIKPEPDPMGGAPLFAQHINQMQRN